MESISGYRFLVIKNEFVDRELASVTGDMDGGFCARHGGLQDDAERSSLDVDMCTSEINKRVYALLNDGRDPI